MGGCRCTFRGCPNNSANSPGMHFFHYPLKYPGRFKLWVKYADTEHFLDIPTSKARNKVVCETHFRDECFMNYKKERLVQFAIPTLVRLPNGMVLDFEESDHPKAKALEPTKSKHLIRPGEDSSTGSSSGLRRASTSEEEYIVEAIEDIQVQASSSRSGPKRDFSQVEFNDDSPKPKILRTTQPPKIINSNLRFYTAAKVRPTLKIETVPAASKFPEELTSNAVFCDDITIEAIEQVEHLEESEEKNEDLMMDSPEMEQVVIQEREEAEPPKHVEVEKVDKATFDELVVNYEEQIKELRDKLEQKEAAEKLRTTQVETVSTSRPPANNPGSMTKAQLFHGIKKYLSPSMAAIVRMEMFGGPERPWKSDEKHVSVELLKLGDAVFNYFRDEWRFRLPSKKDVQQWLLACDSVEEEEDL